MEEQGDDDLQLIRALATLIDDIYALLKVILWKTAPDTQERCVHRFAREQDLIRIISKIEPFQADPQLLDPHLKTFVSQLWTSYLISLSHRRHDGPKPGQLRISIVICKILYTLCKVRGEKVIVGIFNNEPKYLEPLVLALEGASGMISPSAGPQSNDNASWEERYILLLWLSHLLLAPFDLATISSLDPGATLLETNLILPTNLAGIPKRLAPIALKYLRSPTKEQAAAASLLSRLCLRPDMLKIGLLNALTNHTLESIAQSQPSTVLHESLGNLLFLSRLIASGNHQEVGQLVQQVFQTCKSVMEHDKFQSLRSSAVARKLVIKMFRNIALMALQGPVDGLDTETVLEDVVGLLLDLVADGDTPIRMAASKSLSLVTMQLNADTSTDVLDAILGSLNEDVLWVGDGRNLAAVNPLRWHGLTLTLSHLLFRRALPTARLPDLLNALLLALNFEQRSATGNSIGTNVRDAANFGIWSIARRYTTSELADIDASMIRAVGQKAQDLPVLHLLATMLLQSACFDPAGNVRRGSSAALQELIGRHPDTVPSGISLVQIVDYHAVGLRKSAMRHGVEAAYLHKSYWLAILNALRDWRGLYSPDESSRIAAADSVAQLSLIPNDLSALEILRQLVADLKVLPLPKVEDRHGFSIAVARLIKLSANQMSIETNTIWASPETKAEFFDEVKGIINVPNEVIPDDHEYFRSPIRRPELTSCSTLELLDALCTIIKTSATEATTDIDLAFFIERLDLCLRRSDEIVLDLIPTAVESVVPYISNLQKHVANWQHAIAHEAGASNRFPGLVLALGAVQPLISNLRLSTSEILETLITRCSPPVRVEARVIALKALHLILRNPCSSPQDYHKTMERVCAAVLTGLNDVTINERGDVGSLVRIEALAMTEELWRLQVQVPTHLQYSLYCTVVRLALERLDRVRIMAAKALDQHSTGHESHLGSKDFDGLNSFSAALDKFHEASSSELREAIVQGYCSSVALGSENVLQTARQALCEWMIRDAKSSNSRIGHFFTTWMVVMTKNPKNDRVSIPLLETLEFLLDYGAVIQLQTEDYPVKWMTLLSLVQKSHFKSTSVPKILGALEVYRCLSEVDQIRGHVLAKVRSMLIHPFPKIRTAAAETLFSITKSQILRVTDWSQPASKLKDLIQGAKLANVTDETQFY